MDELKQKRVYICNFVFLRTFSVENIIQFDYSCVRKK